MPDLSRIVSLSSGGRPVEVLDINDMESFFHIQDSLEITPADRNPLISSQQRRYGGGKVVGEIHGNGQVKVSIGVRGTSPQDAITRIEEALAVAENPARGRFWEWKPDGATHSVLYELAGPMAWQPKYRWIEFAGANWMTTDITMMVLPLARGLSCDVGDGFQSTDDFTFDSGVSTDLVMTDGEAVGAGTLTTERRARHTARGYTFRDGQAGMWAEPGPTLTSFKAGRTLRASASDTYVEVYIDDNGTNSRLRIDVVIAGSRTNRYSSNLSSRISNGTQFWIRGRIEAGTVYGEYWTSAPTPMGTPTKSATPYTLSGGENSVLVAGSFGFTWTPQHANASIGDYTDWPFTYRNATTPLTISLDGEIPGDGPAKVDLRVTPSGGSAAPIWALAGWTTRAGTPVSGVAPFGAIQGESGSLTTWASTADANYRGGTGAKATTSGAGTAQADFTIDPATLVADDFTEGELDLEVWGRFEIASTVVSPVITLSTRPSAGTSFGAQRYTAEWGSAGKLLTLPSSGTRFRIVRLGTLTVYVDPDKPLAWTLRVGASWAAGSSGQFGFDELLVTPARQRACSPSGKPNDGTYPPFVASTSQTTKLVRTDLSGMASAPPANPHPDHGLGGQLLQFPPGDVDVLLKLSSLVPDDPTSDATSEQLSHSATVRFSFTPTYWLVRA